MPDHNFTEFSTPDKGTLWDKILRRKKVSPHDNTSPITKSAEEPKVVPPDPLKKLQDWWSSSQGRYNYGELFYPWGQSPALFTSDSNLPLNVTNSVNNSTAVLREKGLIPFSAPEMVLPLDSEQIKGILPPYLKLSLIDIDESHRAYLVNPSSGILELTKYREGRFLFRGEASESPSSSAELIIKRFKEGSMTAKDRSEVYTTPNAITAARAFAYGSRDNGIVWIIDREAMNNHPISIQNAGVEVLFPKISLKYLVGCATSPEVEKTIKNSIALPPSFIHTMPSRANLQKEESLNYLEQMDENFMNYLKVLEAQRISSASDN